MRLFRKSKNKSVTMGGERIPVFPIALEAALELLLLMAPYLAAIERHWSELQAALASTNGQRPALLSALFTVLAGEMRNAPGDLTRAVALLVGRDAEWVARYALPAEVVMALPVLDEINDFDALWQAMQGMGLTARYVRPRDGTSRSTN